MTICLYRSRLEGEEDERRGGGRESRAVRRKPPTTPTFYTPPQEAPLFVCFPRVVGLTIELSMSVLGSWLTGLGGGTRRVADVGVM